jgi:hypothetical protein
MGDPVLLIHSDTTHESTTFVDSSGNDHPMAKSGTAYHSTNQQKFGATSIRFEGSGGLVVTNDGDFDLGTGDFTIDYWVWKSSFSATNYQFDIGDRDYYIRTIGGVLQWRVGGVTLIETSPPPTSQQVHIALVKLSGTTTLYYNGVEQASTTNTVAIGSADDLTIGNAGNLITYSLVGFIDEFRILKGEAAWSSDFTPPTAPYEDPLPWDGTIQTPEIIIELSNSADIQIDIGSPEASIVVIQSSGDLFIGVGIETPEIVVALSNSSDTQISVAQPEAQIVIGASSDIQIQLSSPEAIINSSHSIGEIFTGALIQTPEILISSSMATNISLFLASPEITVTSDHDSDLAILLASPEIIIGFSITTGDPEDPEDPAAVTFTTERAYICYLFSLTKVPGIPDIEIPISSFQSRLRNGDPSYLSVVIPGLDYSGAISVRADADMVVEMAYRQNDSYIQREEIARVTLENVVIHQGANKQSITLSGHRTNTYSTKGFRTRQSPFYYTLSANAKARYRFPRADFDLNPGDSFTVGSDVFEVGLITHVIGGGSQQMEVAEA